MKVLVCGGRDFNSPAHVAYRLGKLNPQPTLVIEGGAKGADRLARDWAEANGIPVKTYPADWERYGRGAGHIRNQQMLDEGKPDLVVAMPGGRGTANMIDRSRKAGVPVIDCSKEPQCPTP